MILVPFAGNIVGTEVIADPSIPAFDGYLENRKTSKIPSLNVRETDLDNAMISQLSANHTAVFGVPAIVTDRLAEAGADTNEDISFMFSPSPQTDPAW